MNLPCDKCITLAICYQIFKKYDNKIVSYVRLYERCELLKKEVEKYANENFNEVANNKAAHPSIYLIDCMKKVEKKIKKQ